MLLRKLDVWSLLVAASIAISSPGAMADDKSQSFAELLREDMRSVSVDEFVNGFIIHCLENTNQIDRLEELLELLVREDHAFKVDAEFAEVMVDKDHVIDQQIWMILSGVGSPAFVGLYDANIFGDAANGCSFGNTRLNSEGLIENLLEKIPSLELLKELDTGTRYQAVYRYVRHSGAPVQLVWLSRSQIKSLTGTVIDVYWPKNR